MNLENNINFQQACKMYSTFTINDYVIRQEDILCLITFADNKRGFMIWSSFREDFEEEPQTYCDEEQKAGVLAYF